MGVDKRYFGEIYLKRWKKMEGLKERYDYLYRVYIPLIEELTFGRKSLDVGFTLDYGIEVLKKRGWITSGLDLVPNDYIVGDFEKLEIPETFDLITMGHCLESFEKPIRALAKAYSLLNYDGLLLITTPNPEMIFNIGFQQFNNFDYKQNHMLIGKAKLEDICKRIGFEIILSHRNISPRHIQKNDLHLLLQRKS